jgi:hypothetical protein
MLAPEEVEEVRRILDSDPKHKEVVEELCRVYELMRRELHPWPGDRDGVEVLRESDTE